MRKHIRRWFPIVLLLLMATLGYALRAKNATQSPCRQNPEICQPPPVCLPEAPPSCQTIPCPPEVKPPHCPRPDCEVMRPVLRRSCAQTWRAHHRETVRGSPQLPCFVFEDKLQSVARVSTLDILRAIGGVYQFL